MSYSNGQFITYQVLASAIVSAAGQAGNFAGPKGATGRLVSIVGVATTGLTVADAAVTLRDQAATEIYGSLAAPFGGGVGAVLNDLTIDDVSAAPAHNNRIPADTALELDGDGGATAGAADFYVTILWDLP